MNPAPVLREGKSGRPCLLCLKFPQNAHITWGPYGVVCEPCAAGISQAATKGSRKLLAAAASARMDEAALKAERDTVFAQRDEARKHEQRARLALKRFVDAPYEQRNEEVVLPLSLLRELIKNAYGVLGGP